MPKGKVKWFNSQKGCGFITPKNGTKDLFVHCPVITEDGYKSLTEGQHVEFETLETEQGPKTINVKKVP